MQSRMSPSVHLVHRPRRNFELHCRLHVLEDEELSGRRLGDCASIGFHPSQCPLLEESAGRCCNVGAIWPSKRVDAMAQVRRIVEARVKQGHRSDYFHSTLSRLEQLQRLAYYLKMQRAPILELSWSLPQEICQSTDKDRRRFLSRKF